MQNEVEKFNSLYKEWWNINGKLSSLHKFNKLRIPYIIRNIDQFFKNKSEIKILDVGCGGGLVAEKLYDNGFTDITGSDLATNSIEVAKQHAAENNKNIIYYNKDFSQINESFDVILCLEVLEHIDNIDIVIKNIFDKTKDGGLIILSTINKTVSSFFESIVAPEYILKIVEKNTHTFNKFIKPEQIIQNLPDKSYNIIDICGISYSILNNEFYIRSNISSNYFIILQKNVAYKI